jgi:hypothetical protein
MGNAFVHVELHTDDLATARKFYENLFEWTLEDMPMGKAPYTMVRVGEGTGGGMTSNLDAKAPSRWLPYVEVDDVGAATKKAEKLGATVAQEPTEIPPGKFSVILDPTGAALALWESKTR